jgi:hypothetical protein
MGGRVACHFSLAFSLEKTVYPSHLYQEFKCECKRGTIKARQASSAAFGISVSVTPTIIRTQLNEATMDSCSLIFAQCLHTYSRLGQRRRQNLDQRRHLLQNQEAALECTVKVVFLLQHAFFLRVFGRQGSWEKPT